MAEAGEHLLRILTKGFGIERSICTKSCSVQRPCIYLEKGLKVSLVSITTGNAISELCEMIGLRI